MVDPREEGAHRFGPTSVANSPADAQVFHGSPYPPPGAGVRELLQALLRRRRGILLWTLAVVSSAVLYTFMTPRTWESDASILLEGDPTASGTPVIDALGWFARSGKIDTEMELIRSRRVIEPTVERLGLHASISGDGVSGAASEILPSLNVLADAEPGTYRLLRDGPLWRLSRTESTDVLGGAMPGDMISAPGIEFTAPEAPAEADFTLDVVPFAEAVEAAQSRVHVSRRAREGDLIGLRCEGGSPEAAFNLCREVSEGYVRLRTDLQRAEASATAVFLSSQSETLRERLRAAEDSLQVYSTTNRVVALDDRASEETRQLAGLMAQRSEIEAERSALAGLIEDIEAGATNGAQYRQLASFPAFLQNQAVTQLVTTLIDLENQRAELALRRTESNPDLVSLTVRIGEVEEQLRQFAASYETGLAAQVASYDQALASAGRRLSTIPGRQVEMARLERETALLGDLYNLIETRRREAELAQAVELPEVRILDAASMPIVPSAPSLPRNVAMGLMLGLALGLGWALLRDLADRSIQSTKETERETGLPVISSIPAVPVAGPLFIGLATNGTREAIENELAREAFRSLTSDLQFLARRMGEGRLKTLVVTSARSNEGKSFVAANLALARSSMGAQTALIDADLRTGGISRMLGFHAAPGLREVLSGEERLPDVLRYVKPGAAGSDLARSMGFLPAGQATLDSNGLLQRPLFPDLLQAIRNRFETLIIDTPPSALLSDAISVGAWADGIVVVARQGVTDREALASTLERLRRSGANVVGMILNDTPPSRRQAAYLEGHALRAAEIVS